jgi:oxaloacetate decarboxylase alpha subunit
MPGIVDTSIRLLTQDPLAGRVSSARLLELAEVLDSAGFHALEISGGGCFASFVERGVESPWEFIRAVRSRCSSPLAMALRGRFLVGNRPASSDVTNRFVATAAANGIDVFRIHDPLNDLSNLTEAATAITESGKRLSVGLVHNPIDDDEGSRLVELARQVPALGAQSVVIDDPAGSLDAADARRLVEALRGASGLEVGISAHGAAGRALAAAVEAARAGGSPIGAALYPIAVALYRPAAESVADTLEGLGTPAGVDTDVLWQAVALIGDSLDDAESTSLAPSIAAKAAQRNVPSWLVEQLAQSLVAQELSERLDDVLDELDTVRRLVGGPPLVAPVGQILGSQALVNVLGAQRWAVIVDDFPALAAGDFGSLPNDVDPAVLRTLELRAGEISPVGQGTLDDARVAGEGIAASEEDLLLLALFGDSARSLLESIRSRGSNSGPLEESGVGREPAARIRELISIVESSEIDELTVEEDDFRVTVRKRDTGALEDPSSGVLQSAPNGDPRETAPDTVLLESPMVGTFYRASEPGAAPFVEEGQTVAEGQTLCILEAMKVMNEVKAEADAVVRKICVQNAEPVEYGQALFELETLSGRPLDAVA